ncbi:MAG: hypothetical protein AMXMBFR33_07750 [Candidatus Xenobia bacterium]
MRRLLLTLLILSATVGAEDTGPTVTFVVDPPQAVVRDQFGELGVAGKAVRLRSRQAYGQGDVELCFQASGYREERLTVSQAYFFTHQRYPPEGTLFLRPDSPTAVWQRYRAWLAGLTVLVGVVIAMLLRMRARERWAEKLRQRLALPATVDSDHLQGKLGRYAVGERLGGGGMATVYRGIDPDRPEADPVALKVLHENASNSLDFRSRFLREVELYRQLSHPHIVRMYDWGEEGGLVYLVLELVEGGSLRQRMRPEGLGPEEARGYLTPLLQAVHYAHQHGVVHRDLKPENILVTPTGKVKVTDFGLGRALDSESLTHTGTALGTPAYMAPEQVKGVHYEPATDQYALGVVAFEVLCGRKPFEADEPLQLVFLHVSEEPPAPSSIRPGIPPGLDAVLLRMLAKEPEQRYPDLAEANRCLTRELEAWKA